MKIERAFTKAGASPYAAIAFRSASSEIRNPDGSVVFAATELEVPAGWSQVAVDVLAPDAMDHPHAVRGPWDW